MSKPYEKILPLLKMAFDAGRAMEPEEFDNSKSPMSTTPLFKDFDEFEKTLQTEFGDDTTDVIN